MHDIRRHRTTRIASWILTICVIGTLIPISTAGAAESQSVLLFPVLDESDSGLKSLAGDVTDALQLALDSSQALAATQFSPHSPLVRRAVAEGRLRQVDVEAAETASPGLALFIGNALDFDQVVLATVQSFNVEDDPKQVKLILSGQAYAVDDNINAGTGDVVDEPVVLRAFGVAGTSEAKAGYKGSIAPLMKEAVRSGAYKAAMTLAGQPVGEAPAKKDRGQDTWKWIMYALALGLLVAGISNAGDDDDPEPGPEEDALPVRNLTLNPFQTNIRVRWDPPTATTLDRLVYQVWRQVDGQGFSLLDGQVDPNATFYTDAQTLDGTHTYQYRVRVIYTNSEASVFKTTGNLQFTR
jgi:hypothetical protein